MINYNIAVKPVYLIALNARYSHSCLALYYLKQILQEDSRYRPVLLELTIKESVSDLLEKILLTEEKEPAAFVFSVYIWNSTLVQHLVRSLKGLKPSVPIILGGPEVAYNPKKWLYQSPADYIVKGPGESAILSLLDHTHPPGLVESSAVKLDEVPFPYSDSDLEQLKNRLVYYESSRGCPFHCSYCLSSCEGQELQYRSLEKVKKELRRLAYSGARVIKMVDRSFNVDVERARKIWSFLMELKDPCSFHFEVHPLFLEDEDFQLLSRAPKDLFHFEVGIQTTSSEELKAVNRAGTWAQIEKKVRRLIEETRIPVHLDQIVALPGADRNSVIRSFNEILRLQPEEFQMGFLKLLPGTELAEGPGQFMVASAEPPYEVLQTPLLSFKEIRRFHRIEELLNSYYNSGLFVETFGLLFSGKFSYGKEPFRLFEQLADRLKAQGRIKPMQWAKLAEILWDGFAQEAGLALKNALRLDWAPLAQGQYLPGFLNYSDSEQIKWWRRALRPLCKSEGIASADFKRGILIWMESSHNEPDDLRMFFSIQGRPVELRFSSERINGALPDSV